LDIALQYQHRIRAAHLLNFSVTKYLEDRRLREKGTDGSRHNIRKAVRPFDPGRPSAF